MQSTGANLEALQAAGYSFEYPGFWSKTVGEYCITISDGVSINDVPYEVQIMSADGSECVHGYPHGFDTAADAIHAAGAWTMRTQGQVAYEADVVRTPTYHDGTPRKQWHELSDIARWSWERAPISR